MGIFLEPAGRWFMHIDSLMLPTSTAIHSTVESAEKTASKLRLALLLTKVAAREYYLLRALLVSIRGPLGYSCHFHGSIEVKLLLV